MDMAGPSTSSSNQMTILQDELVCAICLELYDNPVQLPCLHSFCFKCIDAKTRGDGRIVYRGRIRCTCATCRKNFTLKETKDLPRNFSLASIVDKFKQLMGLKKVLCPVHNQDVGLFCEDCTALMCFSCFGDHKGHKIDDVKKVCAKYQSKMELTLLPGLYGKQRQLEEATTHWNDIVQKEKDARAYRMKHIVSEMEAMRKMMQRDVGEELRGMALYNVRMSNKLIAQCENNGKTVGKELDKIKKLIKDIISESEPTKTLATYTEIIKSGDHEFDKLSECAVNLTKKGIHMHFDPGWRKKFQEFVNSIKLVLTGVEEDCPEMTFDPLDEDMIFVLQKMPEKMHTTEMEDKITGVVPLKDVKSLDVVFDKDCVIVHFGTSNMEFLNLHKGTSPDTVFEWNLKLQHEINPVKSTSKVTAEGIEVTLIKARKEHWGVVERTDNSEESVRVSPAETCSLNKSTHPIGISTITTAAPAATETCIVNESTQSTVSSMITTISPTASETCSINDSTQPTNSSTITTVAQIAAENVSINDSAQLCVSSAIVTNSNSKKRQIEQDDSNSSPSKKRKQKQLSDEEVSDLVKEMIENSILENLIKSEILKTHPEFDISCKRQVIKDTICKIMGKAD